MSYDGIRLNPGAGGDVIATDNIGGSGYQQVKVGHGLEGSFTDSSATNPFPIVSNGGFISTNNSSTSTLGISGVFTGTGEDVSNYSSIGVAWNSDVASTKLGLSMEFSPDNTNWDRKIPVSSHNDSLSTNHGGVHRLSVAENYFRVVYTNGATAQAEFRLQSMYHTDSSLPLISRIEQQLNTSSDVNLVRPVTVPELDLARQQITGQRTFFFFGHNDDIGAAWEDIRPEGGDFQWQTTASTVAVSSSNILDDAGASGCRQVEIHGLSATGEDQDEVITMDGTTEAASLLSYIRINSMHTENVGAYGGSHQGDITLRVSSGGAKTGDVLATMVGLEGAVNVSLQYGLGESSMGKYSVPLGKVLYITGGGYTINTTGTKTADVVIYERDGLLINSAPFEPRRVLWNAVEVQGNNKIEFDSFIKIKALTDIWFRAQASNAGTAIGVKLEFFLVDANADGA